LFALMSPKDALIPDQIVVGLILAGGVYFTKMWIFNREVLETEPGEPNAFRRIPVRMLVRHQPRAANPVTNSITRS
jgi:hypothetical protein